MSRKTLLIEDLQKSTEIRAEEFLEIIRRCFRQKNPVGFDAAPVRNRDSQPTFHSRETGPQILLLAGEWRFQDPFEKLFMAKLQSLLDCRIRIKRDEACMVISAAGAISPASPVAQARNHRR